MAGSFARVRSLRTVLFFPQNTVLQADPMDLANSTTMGDI